MTKPLLGFMDRLEPSTAVYDCDLERLINEWRQQAWGIERTRGDGDPGAMALRGCCTDLAELILSYREQKKITNNTAQQEVSK